MPQHSSENLMERAKLNGSTVAVYLPLDRYTASAVFKNADSTNFNFELTDGMTALLHAQRVKMAQVVVKWLDEKRTKALKESKEPAPRYAQELLVMFSGVFQQLRNELEAQMQAEQEGK